MLKFVLMTITLFFMTTAQVSAGSDLKISSDSSFSFETNDFSPGQTIYVKVDANSQGSKKRELNLRSNDYNKLATYSLEHLGGNQFKGLLPAPTAAGYYSLEARVESESSVSTSVKTIKIGESNDNASVKVDVDVSASGQRVLSQTSTSTSTGKASPSPASSPSPSAELEPSPTIPGSSIDFEDNKSFFDQISEFFKKLFDSIF